MLVGNGLVQKLTTFRRYILVWTFVHILILHNFPQINKNVLPKHLKSTDYPYLSCYICPTAY